jgi:hypothetical protein
MRRRPSAAEEEKLQVREDENWELVRQKQKRREKLTRQ